MQRSETLTKIAPALVKALAKIEGVAKSKPNPGFKGSKYATLENVIDASKEHLTEFGLTVLQLPGPLANGVLTLETMILHESGEFISGDFGIALGKQDPQGVGSAISYARRYALMAALNMPAVDDDGEAAHGRQWGSNGQREPFQNINPSPEGEDWWGCDGPGPTSYAAKKDGLGDLHDRFCGEIITLGSAKGLIEWCENITEDVKKMPRAWRIELRNRTDERGKELGAVKNARAA